MKILLLIFPAIFAAADNVHVDGNFNVDKLLAQLRSKGIYASNDKINKPNAYIVYVSSSDKNKVGSLDVTFFADTSQIPAQQTWGSSTSLKTTDLLIEIGKYVP